MEVDLSQLPFEVCRKMDEIFRGDADLRILQGIQRQTATARARRDNVRWDDDMVPQFEIDPVIDAHWRRYYGHNYTENRDLMRFLANRNPEIVMRARSGKVQVGYAGKAESGKRKAERPKPRSAVRFAPGTMRFAS